MRAIRGVPRVEEPGEGNPSSRCQPGSTNSKVSCPIPNVFRLPADGLSAAAGRAAARDAQVPDAELDGGAGLVRGVVEVAQLLVRADGDLVVVYVDVGHADPVDGDIVQRMQSSLQDQSRRESRRTQRAACAPSIVSLKCTGMGCCRMSGGTMMIGDCGGRGASTPLSRAFLNSAHCALRLRGLSQRLRPLISAQNGVEWGGMWTSHWREKSRMVLWSMHPHYISWLCAVR